MSASAPPSITDVLRGAGLASSHASEGSQAGSLLALATDDPSLHASALGKNAHVRLETDKDGDLSLHLTVRDGVVDVRFDGAASRTLDIRPNEVRAALASEGIALGSFESKGGPSVAAPGSSNNPTGSDAAAGGNQPGQPTSPGAAPTSSHAGSSFGGGGRHSDPGDRWPDRQPTAESLPGPAGASASGSATAKSAIDPRRRRGFHVTA